ncbi:uncharacterized protein LOC130442978 [Diorhabda sublineata]|uniref:uncharacterized protein LOC130442978 n=1 Tax=Diorhabda sublineata TaxID=1163346 RepID=UPI0024E0B8A5|nr:uncharacterized protein LOC130442978 [Diorhabda sublineata]
MERLCAERTQLRRFFTITANGCEETFGKPEATVEEVTVAFMKLTDKADRLFLLDDKVKEIMFESLDQLKEEDLGKEFETVEKYRDTWLTLSARKNELLKKVKANTACPTEVSSAGPSDNLTFKLPKLDLPKFDITPKTWISFWAYFKKIHEREDLPSEDKFLILLRIAKDGTQAKELLSSYPASGANYPKAFGQLKNRFGRDELLIELYVRELLSLVLVQASGKVSLTPAQFYDKLETQLVAWESLGVTSEKYACMLAPLIESALPESILREWERKRKSSGTDESLFEAADQMVKLLSLF